MIRTRHHTILVDTCVGNDRRNSRNFDKMRAPYLQSLEQADGVKPEQVDYVVCTHTNVDHIGWNTRMVNGRWVPTFPTPTVGTIVSSGKAFSLKIDPFHISH